MMTNPAGRITQGQFSFLPDLTDAEIMLQVEYGLRKGYAWSVEYTDDPHPRNTYWEMYGNPMFDLKDPAGPGLERDRKGLRRLAALATQAAQEIERIQRGEAGAE